MKRVYVNERWCLGCRLCEYNCAHANSGVKRMSAALKGRRIYPRIRVEEVASTRGSATGLVTFAVSCRHCIDPRCVRSCISGALTRSSEGVVRIDKERCVGCLTCVLACPYGAVMEGPEGVAQKCELCSQTGYDSPNCVAGCPNRALVYEERI
ncbi:MAG: 4Fe-4S binding protein [Planctomycetia bacterium]|nr:4Fe-4S binding protein [Planctomycetia bacterium]